MFKNVGNIFKNLFKKPETRLYPFQKREPFKDVRGTLEINIDDCIFCGMCQRKCPSNAINVDRNEKKWEVDPFKCIMCGYCEEVCPKKCLYSIEKYKSPATEKQKQMRKKNDHIIPNTAS